MGIASSCGLVRCLCLMVLQDFNHKSAEIVSQWKTWLGRIHFHAHTLAVVKIELLKDHWTEGLSSLLAVGWGLPLVLCLGPVHKAAHNMIVGFLQSK